MIGCLVFQDNTALTIDNETCTMYGGEIIEKIKNNHIEVYPHKNQLIIKFAHVVVKEMIMQLFRKYLEELFDEGAFYGVFTKRSPACVNLSHITPSVSFVARCHRAIYLVALW